MDVLWVLYPPALIIPISLSRKFSLSQKPSSGLDMDEDVGAAEIDEAPALSTSGQVVPPVGKPFGKPLEKCGLNMG